MLVFKQFTRKGLAAQSGECCTFLMVLKTRLQINYTIAVSTL